MLQSRVQWILSMPIVNVLREKQNWIRRNLDGTEYIICASTEWVDHQIILLYYTYILLLYTCMFCSLSSLFNVICLVNRTAWFSQFYDGIKAIQNLSCSFFDCLEMFLKSSMIYNQLFIISTCSLEQLL